MKLIRYNNNLLYFLILFATIFSCRENLLIDDEESFPPDTYKPLPQVTTNNLKLIGNLKSKSSSILRLNLLGFKNFSNYKLIGTNVDSQNVWIEMNSKNKGIKVQQVSPYNLIPLDMVLCINTTNNSLLFIIDTLSKQLYKFTDYYLAYGLDIRLGAVGFIGDIRGYFDLTDDFYYLKSWMINYRFRDTLNQLIFPYYGASELMENPIAAVKFADSTFSWRTGSLKLYVIITDKPIYPGGKSTWSLDWLATKNSLFSINVFFVGDPNKYASQYLPYNYNIQNPRFMADYTGGTYKVINKNEIDLLASPLKEMITNSYSIDFKSETGNRKIKCVVKFNNQIDGEAFFTFQ